MLGCCSSRHAVTRMFRQVSAMLSVFSSDKNLWRASTVPASIQSTDWIHNDFLTANRPQTRLLIVLNHLRFSIPSQVILLRRLGLIQIHICECIQCTSFQDIKLHSSVSVVIVTILVRTETCILEVEELKRKISMSDEKSHPRMLAVIKFLDPSSRAVTASSWYFQRNAARGGQWLWRRVVMLATKLCD